MHIHTISAYETSAEEFFKRLVDWKVDLVVDTRLKNTNQLAGFTKRDDLAYFVEELVHARYVHDKLFAPAPTMMERYIHGNIGWDAYADAYREDMREREACRSSSTVTGTASPWRWWEPPRALAAPM